MDAHSEHTSSTHKPFYDNKLIKKNKVKNEIQKKYNQKKKDIIYLFPFGCLREFG